MGLLRKQPESEVVVALRHNNIINRAEKDAHKLRNMEIKNVYLVDVWQQSTMLAPGAQAIKKEPPEDLTEELSRYRGKDIKVAIKNEIYADALYKEAGICVKPNKGIDLEFRPGDIVLLVRSKGKNIKGLTKFPEGNKLKLYRFEIYRESDITLGSGELDIPEPYNDPAEDIGGCDFSYIDAGK